MKDLFRDIKKQVEKVEELNKNYEYKVLCDSIKDPKLCVVEDYFKSEDK